MAAHSARSAVAPAPTDDRSTGELYAALFGLELRARADTCRSLLPIRDVEVRGPRALRAAASP